MAELVVHGRTSVPIHHYRLDRFWGQRLSYLMQIYRESKGSPCLPHGGGVERMGSQAALPARA